MSEMNEALNLPSMRDDLAMYRVGISYEIGDVPIGTLCLPKVINTILKREGYLRVRDLLGVSLHNVKGISSNRANIISQRMRTFFAYDL